MKKIYCINIAILVVLLNITLIQKAKKNSMLKKLCLLTLSTIHTVESLTPPEKYQSIDSMIFMVLKNRGVGVAMW